MGFQRGINREQAILFPVCLDEMIPEEHPVRIIDLFIQNLDLNKLGFIHTIPENILNQLNRQEKYLAIKKKLEESGEDQISTTDPDSRSMILHGSVIEVAFNVKTAVDEKNKLIVQFWCNEW